MSSSYIARAACHGQRPNLYQADSGFQRSHLISRLLKERGVARFVVAPPGYGKSLLAVDYAETVFGWQHTFWFNAQSPCFIRDIDADVLASACLEFDAEAALAVFDDVPWLDGSRMDAFSAQVDKLLRAGCEVIVNMVPSCKLAGSLQKDRLQLDGYDLLLSDEEMGNGTVADTFDDPRMDSYPVHRRIAALAWSAQGDGGAADLFKKHLLAEELPSDVLGVVATMLVLQSASLEVVRSIVAIDDDMLVELHASYPHLGISDDLSSFRCVPIPVDELFALSRGVVNDIAANAMDASRDALLRAWADQLIYLGNAERACELMACLGMRPANAEWCVECRRDLVAQAPFFAMLPLLKDAGRATTMLRTQMGILKALSYQVLGEGEGALRVARRIAFEASVSSEQRAWAAMIVCKLGAADEARTAMNCLQQLDVQALELTGESPDWQLLVRMRCACDDGLFAAVEAWETLAEIGASRDVLCTGAAWTFALYRNAQDGGAHASGIEGALAGIEGYVRSILAECDGHLDFFAASAGLALESAHGRGLAYVNGPLEAPILLQLRQVEMRLLSQRGQFNRKLRENREQQGEWARMQTDTISGVESAMKLQVEQRVPKLTLRLFGSFEALLGDESIDERLNRRRNARTLLAMLAVNDHKEVPRDVLARVLWPDSDIGTARKNFYTVWGYLRQVLMLPDGSCPYLIRRQYGCSLEKRHVRSDVVRLGELCRELLFGPADRGNWLMLYTEINRDFAGDLLPGETTNALIVDARDKLRSHLVDALVSASGNVMETGQPQWGVYFAREAIEHDDTREDAYVALMRAQIASSQRTSAMMTYLRCQKVLADQLGIDPSPETEAIYEELLSGRIEEAAYVNA